MSLNSLLLKFFKNVKTKLGLAVSQKVKQLYDMMWVYIQEN
jgi:hypothetical protein